jgi:hypothetical protein
VARYLLRSEGVGSTARSSAEPPAPPTGLGEEEARRIAEVVRAGEDEIDVPPELTEEPAPPGADSLPFLNAAQWIKVALRGNRKARALVFHRPDQTLWKLALQNPTLLDDELVALARNPQSSSELLRLIAESDHWGGLYTVRCALIENPRTPLVYSLRILGSLSMRDLRLLSRNRNVPAALVAQARARLEQKQGKFTGMFGLRRSPSSAIPPRF